MKTSTILLIPAMATALSMALGGGAQTAVPRFRLTVQLMDDPCLWRWDIYDPARGGLVESSWSSEWAAYRSAEEAYQAGRERLRTLERRAGA